VHFPLASSLTFSSQPATKDAALCHRCTRLPHTHPPHVLTAPKDTHAHTHAHAHGSVNSSRGSTYQFFCTTVVFFSFHARFEHTVPWVVGASSEAFTIPLALTAARERTNESCSVSGRFNLRALVNQTTKQCVAPAKPLTRIVYLAHGCEQTLQSSTPAAIG
jgi:hypothetical protein